MKKDCNTIFLSLFEYYLIYMFTEISMYKYINYEK